MNTSSYHAGVGGLPPRLEERRRMLSGPPYPRDPPVGNYDLGRLTAEPRSRALEMIRRGGG